MLGPTGTGKSLVVLNFVTAAIARGQSVVQGDANRDLADYPDRAFLIGSSFKPDAAAAPNFSVFDNYIQDASYLTGMIAISLIVYVTMRDTKKHSAMHRHV